MSNILGLVQRAPIQRFDPSKRDHMVAFACMVSLKRQHPTLRFKLEAPYADVYSMMVARVAEYTAEKHVEKAKSLFAESSTMESALG